MDIANGFNNFFVDIGHNLARVSWQLSFELEQCILHDNNLIRYNNACIIGFNVGPEKEVPLSKGHPPYKANLRPAEDLCGLIRGGPL